MQRNTTLFINTYKNQQDMPQINTKSIARIAAIQTFYNHESTKQEHKDIGSSLLGIINYYKENDVVSDMELPGKKNLKIKPSYNFLNDLVKFTFEDLNNIDKIIEDHLTSDWTIERLPGLLLAILRVAIGEIIYFPDIPIKVVISEYTDIAGNMLDNKDVGFVNSLLENCAKKVRS